MTPGCWKRSAGRTPAFCLNRPQVSGAGFPAGCTELTPFQGASCVSSSLASLSPPWAPRLGTTFLSCLSPKVPAPTIQNAHLPSPSKTRRGGLPAPGAPGGHWACSVVRQVPGGDPLRSLADPPAAARPPLEQERAHDGGGGERQRRQQRRRRQRQQRHVQHRRGGADAAPLPDVRRRRGRIH